MDGTLLDSPLDFDRIRRECGVPAGVPIMRHIATMEPAGARRARATLEEHECRAAAACTLKPQTVRVLDALALRGYRVGLLTNNSRRCLDTVLGRFRLRLDGCVSRDEAESKPSPALVLLLADRLGVRPEQMLVVGDCLFDVEAGRRASARTAFLQTERALEPPPEADLVLDELDDLLALLPCATEKGER